jgi:hypothetical protein
LHLKYHVVDVLVAYILLTVQEEYRPFLKIFQLMTTLSRIALIIGRNISQVKEALAELYMSKSAALTPVRLLLRQVTEVMQATSIARIAATAATAAMWISPLSARSALRLWILQAVQMGKISLEQPEPRETSNWT